MARDCSSQDWLPPLEWMFSEARMRMDFQFAWSSSDHVLCRRCEQLDLIGMLDGFPPWTSQKEQEEAVSRRDESIRSLGDTGTVEFWDDCHVCRCLFALTPNPYSNDQEVLLLPDWSLYRVTGEFGAVLDTPEKRQYATCLVVALDPGSISLPFAVHAHRSDAMCLMAEDLQDGRTLGGRKLMRGPTNMEMVKEWIGRCARLHGTHCAPVLTEELTGIRLIDVQQRRIVKFPGFPCDYVALSYVWGGVPAKSYKLGDVIGPLAKTLEDAISFTKGLGKPYLWTDFLCIDQSNDDEKADQIGKMWSIYRGAYVTIYALSGSSAEAGLSGFGRAEYCPQLTCCVRGRRLVGTMPTFSLQSWMTVWAQRAWTLQEAYLAPRCLFFSDHQMYFDCTAMLCCETLDDLRSWGHNLTQASNSTGRGFLAWVTDQIGAGSYRIPLRDPAKRLENWGVKLNMYSYRQMSYDVDAQRAFEGIAQQLTTMYPEGFFQGLPIEDFDWGLLWRSQWPPTRRQGFPSWTWAGWKGGLWFGQPFEVTQTRRYSVSLEVCSFKAGQANRIFKTEFASLKPPASHLPAKIDPISRASPDSSTEDVLRPDQLSTAEKDGILMIDAVCLQFTVDFSHPWTNVQRSGQNELFDFMISDTRCIIQIISVDKEISRPEQRRETFILIARDSIQGFISHHLLMVRHEQQEGRGSNLAVRATTLELLVPQDRLIVLQELEPRVRRIFLA